MRRTVASRRLLVESLEGRQLLAADFSDVRVTELHYNPQPGDQLEFLELRNFGATAVSLNGWDFTAGFTLTLGAVSLAPGAYGVVVADTAAFTAFYGPGINILGQITSGTLRNSGEQVALETADGQAVFDFSYFDSQVPGWPTEADGNGNSLVVVNPTSGVSLDLPTSWRASSQLHGSPGTDDSVVTPQLTLGLSRQTTVESTGIDAATGTISRSGPTTQAVTVLLMNEDPTEIFVPTQVIIPAGSESANFRIDAVDDGLLDGNKNVTISISAGGHLPSDATIEVIDDEFTGTPAQDFLRITEINYLPHEPSSAEANAGFTTAEFFDYVELTNIGGSAFNLQGAQFTDGITFVFGNRVLNPSERVVIVADEAAFRMRYGSIATIAGVYTGKLNDAGETLRLRDPGDDKVLTFAYDVANDWPTRAAGQGSSLEVIDLKGDYTDPFNWRPSSEYGGTPGIAGLGRDGRVLINEILSHTDLPQTDAFELYNTTATAIDISGWLVSDSTDYRKFTIPGGTVLPVGGYVSFDEHDFNASGLDSDPNNDDPRDFRLSASHGDRLTLMQTGAGETLRRFVDSVEFDATFNGVTLGRFPNGQGDLFPIQLPTLGGPNGDPQVPEVAISEIHYNSVEVGGASDLEFLEIHNNTGNAVVLTEWQLRDGVSFDFAAGTILPGGAALTVVSFDPAVETAKLAAFRAAHNIGGAVPIVGPYSGNLSNGGERIKLLKPDSPPTAEPDFTPHVLMDTVLYDDDPPWPADADGTGESLTRINNNEFAGFATNWIAAVPTPGTTPDLNSSFHVISMRKELSGAEISFLRDADLSQLNLYDGQDAPLDATDVTLVGAASGPVTGSLVWDSARRALRFVKTGGPLVPDTYTLRVAGRGDSLLDIDGVVLDGDGNNSPGGDFVSVFTVAATDVRWLSIDDFSRGRSQPVEMDGTTGIPIRLDQAAGVERVEFDVQYDPALLQVNGVQLSGELPAGWFLAPVDLSHPGKIDVIMFGTRPLPAGARSLVTIDAEVPESAGNGAAHTLRIDDVLINGGAIAASADDAMHVVAYLGDVTGNGDYSALDASLIARAAVKLDSGFDAYGRIDPVVVGDVSGNGDLSSFDAALVARKAVGLSAADIPDLPQPAPLAVAAAAAPEQIALRTAPAPQYVLGPAANDRTLVEAQQSAAQRNSNAARQFVRFHRFVTRNWGREILASAAQSTASHDLAQRFVLADAGVAAKFDAARDELFARIGRAV